MPELVLTGCAPIPLAHYLKALGILRLVAECQHGDSAATACWQEDQFVLHSRFDRAGLVEFFLRDYEPTPIVAPWNGGSGFYEGDDQAAVESIGKSEAPRLAAAKRSIEAILAWPQLGPTKQPLRDMVATLEKEAAQSAGKAANDLRHLIAEFSESVKSFSAQSGIEEQQVAESHIEQVEALDVGSSRDAKKGLSNLLKAGKKVRTAFKKCHRASGKELLVLLARSSLPDSALPAIDAMVPILAQGTVAYPPLFGSGGTDGRLEFTNTFLRCLCEIIQPESGQSTPESLAWLKSSLFQEVSPGPLSKAPIGQFFPGAAGGANATSGFDGDSIVNPWDYVLMMEGGVMFSGAVVKKLNSSGDGSMVCPFCVSHSGAGFASATRGDEAKAGCEIWTPLWRQRATFGEIQAVFSEGRAQLRGSSARTGVDFAQAAVTLGVDRGISEFQRYALLERNGLSNFATPVGRFVVRRNARADLLADAHRWLSRLRGKTDPDAKPKAPNAVCSAFNVVERRIIDLCQGDSPDLMLALLASLGATERAIARSFKWATTKDKAQRENASPLYGLRPQWLNQIANCVEMRLASALAGTSASFGKGKERLTFRQHLEPLKRTEHGEFSSPAWTDKNSENDVVWHEGDLVSVLNAIAARRIMRFQQAGADGWLDWSPRYIALEDITAFIEGRVNEELLADLLWGIACVDHEKMASAPGMGEEPQSSAADQAIAVPSAFYALLKLCHHRLPKGEQPIPLVPAILHRAMNGDGKTASELAARRLTASGYRPLVTSLPVSGDIARRTAAAMLFPISPSDFRLLKQTITHKPKEQTA
jgi:CRISPR-associated protein Csx17